MTPDPGPNADTLPENLAVKVLRGVGRLELIVMLLTFTGVVILVSVQVLLRYVFEFGIVWAQEVAQLLMLVAYFFGASYVYKARHYLIIDYLFNYLPERWKIIFYLATQVITVVFCMMLLIELVRIAPHQLRMRTYILHIPQFYSSLPLVLASASMAATALYYGVRVGLLSGWGSSRRTLADLEDATNLFPEHKTGPVL